MNPPSSTPLFPESGTGSRWTKHTVHCPDGEERPFLLKLPGDVSGDQAWPLMISLHGGVMRPDFQVNQRPASLDPAWGWVVEEGLCALAVPVTNHAAPWWTEAGAGFVQAVLKAVETILRVDPDRVFCLGHSDGAAGAFYLALNHPTAFAGFICLNGVLSGAANGGRGIFPRNLRSRPLLVINSGMDRTFALDWVLQDIRAIQKAGLRTFLLEMDTMDTAPLEPDEATLSCPAPKLIFHIWKSCGHNPAPYLPAERSFFRKFIAGTSRNEFPAGIEWSTESGSCGGCDWISIDALRSGGSFPKDDASTTAVAIQAPRQPFARIKARRDGAAITIESEQVESFSINLSARFIPLDSALELWVNGVMLFEGEPGAVTAHRGHSANLPRVTRVNHRLLIRPPAGN